MTIVSQNGEMLLNYDNVTDIYLFTNRTRIPNDMAVVTKDGPKIISREEVAYHICCRTTNPENDFSTLAVYDSKEDALQALHLITASLLNRATIHRMDGKSDYEF